MALLKLRNQTFWHVWVEFIRNQQQEPAEWVGGVVRCMHVEFLSWKSLEKLTEKPKKLMDR